MLQLTSWRARDLHVNPDWARELSPDEAATLHAFLNASLLGNIMTAPPLWHHAFLNTIIEYVEQWSRFVDDAVGEPLRRDEQQPEVIRRKAYEPPADFSEWDGIKSSLLSELIGAHVGSYGDAKDEFEKLTSMLGARPALPRGAGYSLVYDFFGGGFGALSDGVITGLLNNCSGWPKGGVLDLSPGASGDSDLELSGMTDHANAKIAAGALGLAAVGAIVGVQAAAVALQPPIALGLLVAVGVFAITGLEGAKNLYEVGTKKIEKAQKDGSKIPGHDGEAAVDRTSIVFRLPPLSADDLKRIEEAKSGNLTEGLTQNEREIMLLEWRITQNKRAVQAAELFNKYQRPRRSDFDDDSGMRYIGALAHWLEHNVPATVTPHDDGSINDGIGGGALPTRPPKKALGVADTNLLKALTSELTVSVEY